MCDDDVRILQRNKLKIIMTVFEMLTNFVIGNIDFIYILKSGQSKIAC